MMWSMQLSIVGRIALAMVLGGIIGLEREISDKPAGFRTHMIIAGLSALFIKIGNLALLNMNDVTLMPGVRLDPLRILQALITGIGFLAAGNIIQRKEAEHVEGLTTAASLLFSAAVGAAVAYNYIILAAGITILLLIILVGMGYIERKIK